MLSKDGGPRKLHYLHKLVAPCGLSTSTCQVRSATTYTLVTVNISPLLHRCQPTRVTCKYSNNAKQFGDILQNKR